MSPFDYTLYLVTDAPEAYPHGLLAGVEAALAGGVTMVQYRVTGGSRREHFITCRALRDLVKAHGVPLIVNDFVDLALAVDAEGVHVGQGDLPVAVARRLIGPNRLLGLSITEPVQFAEVDPQVVDYLGIGPVFPTGSKADAAPALGLSTLGQLTAQTPLPVVAIGGISNVNTEAIFAQGVAGIAVISALSRVPDPAAAARELRSLAGLG